MTSPSTAPRLNPSDADYQLVKKLTAAGTPSNSSPVTGSGEPGDPAGWFEEDPSYAGGVIWHPPPGVTSVPTDVEIPVSSNFVPDPAHTGGGLILQTI